MNHLSAIADIQSSPDDRHLPIHRFGSYKARGVSSDEADQIKRDAVSLQQAGAFALVLEKVPAGLASQVTKSIDIPTIGIGAGARCDGQILVTHDMLGIFTKFRPRFVRRYAEMQQSMREAFERYRADVKTHDFPSEDESY